MLSAGYKINVYGDSWKNFRSDYSDNLIIHQKINVAEASQIYRKARIGLNFMTWHKAGMTERVADIMLGGAVCISDTTTHLREKLSRRMKSYCLTWARPEQLVTAINQLLKDDTLRHKIAQAGYERAVHEHTMSTIGR